MNDVVKVLKRVAVYYLLGFACNIIKIYTSTGIVRSIDSVLLFCLSVVLSLYYDRHVTKVGKNREYMKTIALLVMFFMALRGFKYTLVAQHSVGSRYAWYCFYIPTILIPLFFFVFSLLLDSEQSENGRKYWWLFVLGGGLVLLVLTNDLHQLVFIFENLKELGDASYHYGPGSYLIWIWEFGLFLAGSFVLLVKARMLRSKSKSWLILIPTALGLFMIILDMLGLTPRMGVLSSKIIQYPESYCLMVLGGLECCLCLGLIPSNDDYLKLMKMSLLPVQITDEDGKVLFYSDLADPNLGVSLEEERKYGNNENYVVHAMKIPGGYGYLADDVSELNQLNCQLSSIKAQLHRDSEQLMIQNKMKEKRAIVEQRSLLYDQIAEKTRVYSSRISLLAEEAKLCKDPKEIEKKKVYIVLIASYIKRFANLVLLGDANPYLDIQELGLAIHEVLRYLNIYGVPGELFINASGMVSSECLLATFEGFGWVIEKSLPSMDGVLVNLRDNEDTILFKMMIENCELSVNETVRGSLEHVGISLQVEYEDEDTYLCLTLPKGGEST